MPFLESDIARSGRFVDIRPIGHGASGQVYYALDTRLNVPVAIKQVRPTDRDFQKTLDRFKRESQIQARLRHTNIISVYDLKEDAHTGEYYLVCEYANNGTLRDYLQQHGPLPKHVAIGITLDICEALEKTASEQIAHCDIKPANILLAKDGNGKLTAKLGDFGIAKGQLWHETTMPPDAHHPGTPLYMAPEQWSVANLLDVRTDLYALGATLFEMLTNTPYKQVAHTTPLGPGAPNLGIDPSMAVVLRKALEDDRRLRFQHPQELAESLRVPLRASQASPAPVQDGLRSLPKHWQALLALFFSLLCVAGVVLFAPKMQKKQAQAVSLPTTAAPPQAQAAQMQPPGHLQPTAPLPTSVAVASIPLPQSTAPIQLRRVLIDNRHDDGAITQQMIAMQLEDFEFVALQNQVISIEILAQYDVLFIYYSPLQARLPEFSPDEIAAIKAYIGQGHSVLLGGLGWTWVQYMHRSISQYPLNQIASDFGVFFTADLLSDKQGGAMVHGRSVMDTEHPITQDVRWVSTGKGANPGPFQIAPPAIPIIWADSQVKSTISLPRPPVVVAAEVQSSGRLVAVQHPDYLLDYLDNRIMLNNILRWLGHLN